MNTESIPLNELLDAVRARGLPIEEQAAFYNVPAGPRIMLIEKSRSGEVRRIDLKGCDDLKHPALRRLTREEAAEAHLGRVSRQINFASAEAARAAFDLVLAAMRPMATSPSATQQSGGATVPLSMRLPEDLVSAIEEERTRIEREAPRGLEVSMTSAIRVLLHEALDARRAKRSA